jgi:hypothetical protein
MKKIVIILAIAFAALSFKEKVKYLSVPVENP